MSADGREVVGKRGIRLGEAEEESAGQGLERFPGWEGVEESGWKKLEADGGGILVERGWGEGIGERGRGWNCWRGREGGRGKWDKNGEYCEVCDGKGGK